MGAIIVIAPMASRSSIDESDILNQVYSVSTQTAGGMVSGFKGQASLLGVRTNRHDLTLPAKAHSFEQALTRKCHAAQMEAKLLIKRAKLAENETTTADAGS
jgi:hypothetical protein